MKELKDRFISIYPQKFFLSNSISELESYLFRQGWLEEWEVITSLNKPGEGNMNFVLRVETATRTFIIKQARPWVEKYPSIDAPVERNEVEALFLAAVRKDRDLKSYSPKLLGRDPDNFIMIMEDLGEGADYTGLYQEGQQMKTEDLEGLLAYASKLHHLDCPSFPNNSSMRQLNHEHIFHFPFVENNGFNLDDVQLGLQEASLPYKRNVALKSAITQLGQYYLSEGPVLIHGDYYPGSWLQTMSGIKIIDAEFSFKGFAEFDLGVLLAHMTMAEQSGEMITKVLQSYDRPFGFDEGMMWGFAGTEILRRLIGVAQLPLLFTVERKEELMEQAALWLLSQ